MSNCNNKPTGHRISMFVTKPSDSFMCPICSQVLRDPKQCINGHCFCSECIQNALKCSSECPTCKVSLSLETLGHNSVGLSAIVEMITFCPSLEYFAIDSDAIKCTWTGKLCDQKAHVDECPFVRQDVDCDHCGENFPNGELYIHESHCGFRPVYCTNKCGFVVAYNQLESHQQSDCPLQKVDCPVSQLGMCKECPGHLIRRDLKEHIAGSARLPDTVLQLCEHVAIQTASAKERDKLSEEKVSQLTAQVADLSTRLLSMSALVTRISSRNDALSANIQDVITQNNSLTAQLKTPVSKPTSGGEVGLVATTPASVPPHSRPTMMGGLTSYATRAPPVAPSRSSASRAGGLVPTSTASVVSRGGALHGGVSGEN
jgi:hypothetical protein